MDITWNDEMSVGREALDQDHQQLINILNRVIQMRRFGNNRIELQETLYELERYAKDHFRREEETLLAAGYPGYDNHQRMHRIFIEKMQDIQHELDNCDTIMVRIDLFVFLSEWLTQHIQGSDAHYAKYISAQKHEPAT